MIYNGTGSFDDADPILTCSLINDEVYDVKFEVVYNNVANQHKFVQVYKKNVKKKEDFHRNSKEDS